jgi:nitroimidazol reductase NimA-like FMN-containing flavoprotein (pyridoxamine 5'-phosphate oxidase superfamily)
MPDSRPTPQERAQRLIDVTTNMTVATVGADGAPWVSPVFFVADSDGDLYWTSETTARHSQHIRETGQAAVVIVEPDPDRRVDAVYMAAKVVELSAAEDIAHGIDVMTRKPQPERWMISGVEDVTGDGPWRIYRAHPESIEVRASDTVNGKAVARRQAAEFRPDHGAQ